MKGLSIKEPYSSMIREGKKTIETRTWKTNYRGLILLCCSKKPESEISGKAFAIAKLVDCRKMIKEDEAAACCELYPNAYSWVLEEVTPIEPLDFKGQLGLFETCTPKRLEQAIKGPYDV